MKIPTRLSFLALLLALPLATACSDSTGPAEPPIESLTVSGVRVDAASFRAQGDFALGLLAKDAAGRSIVDARAKASAVITQVEPGNPGGYTLGFVEVKPQAPTNQATYAAILLDDSGSMSWNDPQRLRASAAQIFWEAVLPVRPDNQVSLLDFGAGTTQGFAATRLLQTWTRSTADLEAQLPRIVASGGTPMYRSLQETSAWMVQTIPANAHRVILLLGDGVPGDASLRMTAINAVRDSRITIHTVGLGEASEAAGATNASAVAAIRELAEQTGGVYSSATDAAALGPIFSTLAQVTSQGQLLSEFRISPVPPSGTRVSGTVTVTSGGRSQTANWSFIAP